MSDLLDSPGSLFDEALQTGFGCVLFDLHDNGTERMVAQYGKGWASINGREAIRVTSPKELSKDICWLTNLDQHTFWISGAVRIQSLRESQYLETDMGHLMREIGLDPKRLMSPKVCETLSEIFSRVMKIAMSHYKFDAPPSHKLLPAIRAVLAAPDASVSMEVDEALSQAYMETMVCTNAKVEGTKRITLKRPRLTHARQVLDTALPHGEWSFYSQTELPSEEERLEWLVAQKRPTLVKVVLKGYLDKCPAWAPPLLQLGESGASIGRKKERGWMTLQELTYFSRYAKMEIKAAWMAAGWQEINDQVGLCEFGELSDLSISLGLLAEAHWLSLSGPSRHPVGGKNVLVTPRACWLRATDRFLCFASAMPLASAGFTIASYGAGEVIVLARPDKFKALSELIPACGLTANTSLYEAVAKVTRSGE